MPGWLLWSLWQQKLPLCLPTINFKQSLAYSILGRLAIVIAGTLWSSEWTGQRITMACDNLATVTVIKLGMTKHTVIQCNSQWI